MSTQGKMSDQAAQSFAFDSVYEQAFQDGKATGQEAAFAAFAAGYEAGLMARKQTKGMKLK